jgi:hypothetical protein
VVVGVVDGDVRRVVDGLIAGGVARGGCSLSPLVSAATTPPSPDVAMRSSGSFSNAAAIGFTAAGAVVGTGAVAVTVAGDARSASRKPIFGRVSGRGGESEMGASRQLGSYPCLSGLNFRVAATYVAPSANWLRSVTRCPTWV